jgi:hypothetical protein
MRGFGKGFEGGGVSQRHGARAARARRSCTFIAFVDWIGLPDYTGLGEAIQELNFYRSCECVKRTDDGRDILMGYI